MQIYIDQSGKIENTRLATVIAFSNGASKSVYISPRDKQRVQTLFREINKPNVFVLKTFVILIYLLIREDYARLDTIIIDREYTGKESLIKKYLIELIRRGGDVVDPKNIHFTEIGKKNSAHAKAIRTFRDEYLADMVVTSKEILRWLM